MCFGLSLISTRDGGGPLDSTSRKFRTCKISEGVLPLRDAACINFTGNLQQLCGMVVALGVV